MSHITVTRPTEQELESLGVKDWPTWTCQVSSFEWRYDRPEICYITQGKATVRTPDGQVSFGQGDLVRFPQGLRCTWDVTEPVHKHYKFT
ncbi:MAG: cupin domain-containing protein [Phycisphaerae bacterium]